MSAVPLTNLHGLLVWVLVTFVAAAVGSLASINAAEFYLQLNRPEWAPPAGVFGPVWTALYSMMALAVWLVSREGSARAGNVPYVLFCAQLVANALWSWLFFTWHQGMLAFIEILVLLALIAATIVSFSTVNRLAAALLVPYMLWVCFATVLTYSVWQRNPGVL